jgi:PAS domain S-box-containing protein
VNILYVESDEKLINLINENCSESVHEIILLNNPKDALSFLKQTNNMDLIITEINFSTLNAISYLKEIRKLKKDILIVITSKLDIYLSSSEFLDLNISAILNKPLSFDKLKKTINNLFKEINIVFNRQETEELKLFIKPFKEFSFYSETDLDGRITDISDSLCDLLGFTKEELIGQKHSILKHPSENPLKYVEIWQTILKGKIWTGELRCLDKFGHDIWYKSILFPKKDINGIIVGYGAKRQDITDRKIAELQSITDDLTNLYNKRFFKQIFSSERNRAKRNKKNLVLLVLDIDNFKKYNDMYGHLEGDKALKKVASVLRMQNERMILLLD